MKIQYFLSSSSSVLLLLVCVDLATSHLDFTIEGCLSAHNALRGRHEETSNVEYDTDLEKSAKDVADFLRVTDDSTDK